MNNNIYSDTYSTYYRNNAATIFMYKSSRKNSKCDFVHVNHLINHTPDRKISDESILKQFIGVIDTLTTLSIEYNRNIEFSYRANIFRQQQYINANNDIYHCVDDMPITHSREQVYSIEQLINQMFTLFMLIYPYSKLSLEHDIYNNSSIKHFINRYYHF